MGRELTLHTVATLRYAFPTGSKIVLMKNEKGDRNETKKTI